MAPFSDDSKIVKVPLPNSVLLKDYLLDDLSSCSSNGFSSYPRQQCFTTVRYLIEIDLKKHIKLPPPQNQFLQTKPKSSSSSSSSSVLQKASAVVVNVFKNFRFKGSDQRRKSICLPRNLSRKHRGFWKRTTDHGNKEFVKLNSSNEPIKLEKENILHPPSEAPTAVTTTTITTELKITSTSNSNSWVSSLDSYFSPTYDSSTTGSCSKTNVPQNDIERLPEEEEITTNGKKGDVATKHSGNAKKERQISEEKDQFSPISVMDFSCGKYNDDEDEVTSPFRHSHFCDEGTRRKFTPNLERIKNLDKLKPVRLEDRIELSECRAHESSLREFVDQTERKAVALLQQLKATMSSHGLFESTMTENVLLGFFTEQIIEGNISNFTILQEAKDWINGQVREEMFESRMSMRTYIRDMEKKVKWSEYEGEVEKKEMGLELEYEVFTCLIHEMLQDFCL